MGPRRSMRADGTRLTTTATQPRKLSCASRAPGIVRRQAGPPASPTPHPPPSTPPASSEIGSLTQPDPSRRPSSTTGSRHAALHLLGRRLETTPALQRQSRFASRVIPLAARQSAGSAGGSPVPTRVERAKHRKGVLVDRERGRQAVDRHLPPRPQPAAASGLSCSIRSPGAGSGTRAREPVAPVRAPMRARS